jgi:hypothetical protein
VEFQDTELGAGGCRGPQSRAAFGNRRSLNGATTTLTLAAGHIGDTLPGFGGTPNAVAGVLQDGRAAAVRGSVAGRGENGGAVPELDITAPT